MLAVLRENWALKVRLCLRQGGRIIQFLGPPELRKGRKQLENGE
jgi:hypothetical protein